MQLNASTCYALQITLYLSKNNRIVSSTELSEKLHISPRYISHIASKLRDGALIGTHAGMSGGYVLNKDVSAISVYDVVVLMEGDMSIPECVRPCKNASLHDALSVLKDYFDTYFKTITFNILADMEITGKLSEIITMVETHIVAMKQKN